MADKPTGSPKSRDEHIARQAKGKSQREVAEDFGHSQSTVSRRLSKHAMKSGFIRQGKAKD